MANEWLNSNVTKLAFTAKNKIEKVKRGGANQCDLPCTINIYKNQTTNHVTQSNDDAKKEEKFWSSFISPFFCIVAWSGIIFKRERGSELREKKVCHPMFPTVHQSLRKKSFYGSRNFPTVKISTDKKGVI